MSDQISVTREQWAEYLTVIQEAERERTDAAIASAKQQLKITQSLADETIAQNARADGDDHWRNYFAAQALAILADPKFFGDPNRIAQAAYNIADAMIEERRKRRAGK